MVGRKRRWHGQGVAWLGRYVQWRGTHHGCRTAVGRTGGLGAGTPSECHRHHAARSADVGLADAVIDAVVEQYTDPGDDARDALLMITTSPALRTCYADTVTTIEGQLADAIAERCPDMDQLTAQVLSVSVGAAAKVALQQWLQSAAVPASMRGFVVPSGSLPNLMRTALMPLVPALDAAAARSRH